LHLYRADAPTIYNERISPIMLVFLQICHGVEKIGSIPGRLERVKETSTGYKAHVSNRSTMTFERVATRFGTGHNKAVNETIGLPSGRMHYGDWLLEPPYSKRARVGTDGPLRRPVIFLLGINTIPSSTRICTNCFGSARTAASACRSADERSGCASRRSPSDS